jgi:uncharacterized protein
MTPNTSGYVSLGRESDLCPKLPGRQSDEARALRAEATMCPKCAFASLEDFDELDFSPNLRYAIENRLEEDGLIKVFRRTDPPWLAFHSAEVCGKERSLSARELGDLCLRASWVCRKERERPFENTFQLRAVRHFMRSLEEDALKGRELSVTTYLVGELNRRLGHHREALNWYVNAGKTLEKTESLAWLERMIETQTRLAEEEAA